jgi:hypothetical protein
MNKRGEKRLRDMQRQVNIRTVRRMEEADLTELALSALADAYAAQTFGQHVKTNPAIVPDVAAVAKHVVSDFVLSVIRDWAKRYAGLAPSSVVESIPGDFPVQPLKPGESSIRQATCGHCGLSWDDGKPTSYTPAPSARCPFEYFHIYP